jgi:hypothetical protein
MEVTQTVSNPTGTPPHEVIKVGDVEGMVLLAMIWIELKPERVQESLAAGDAATLSLQLAIHQSQTVTFGLSGSGLTITFNNSSTNNGDAAPAA